MNEFLPWLYTHYIYPYQEEHITGSGYEMELSLLESNLAPEDRNSYRQSREFFSIQAFLLGFNTGPGLARHI